MNEDLIKIGLPLLFGVLLSILTYRLGRRARIDEKKIEKGVELGQEITILFQDVAALEDRLYEFYRSNYEHLKNVDKAVDNFEKMKTLYEPEYSAIDELSNKKQRLEERIKEGRYLLKSSILVDMQTYLDLLKFKYDQDVFGSMTTFYRQLFLNIMDSKSYKKRKNIKRRVLGKLHKLLP
jgi:uncharacterized membrane-anchored protein YhcB (DUF1043 family)